MLAISIIVFILIVIGLLTWAVSYEAARAPSKAPDGEATDTTSTTTSTTTTTASTTATGTAAEITAHADLIVVDSPTPGGAVASPLTITGKARGSWYFEASFPIVLVDWDGKIVAEGHAEAQGDWMTTDFVPFTATLDFTSPYHAGDPDFMKRGALILRKDNPSGLPEHDDALEFPVIFQ